MSSKRRGIWFSTSQTKTYPRGPRFWISTWWPVAVGIAIITVESTAAFGSDRTSYPLRWLVQLLFGQLSDTTWDLLHHLIRKSGHFLGYGTLGLLWLRAWRMTAPDTRFLSQAGLALFGTALVASWDEWHQTFLPNRTGSPYDVLLDCCGAAFMMGIVYMYLRLFHRSQPACKNQERPTALRIAMYAGGPAQSGRRPQSGRGQMAFIHGPLKKQHGHIPKGRCPREILRG